MLSFCRSRLSPLWKHFAAPAYTQRAPASCLSVADYIAQYGKCARGTALLTSFDKLRSQKNIRRNPTKPTVDSPRSSRKPTICVPFTVLRGPRVFGYFDPDLRWTSAIWQLCPSSRGDPLNADQSASISTVEIRQHVSTGRVSSKTFWTSQYQLGGTASEGFSKRLLSRLPRFYWSMKRHF